MRPQRLMWLVPCVLVALAVTGAAASGILLAQHDGGWNTAPSAGGLLWRFCEPPALPSASCADVVGSRFGSFDFYIGSRRVLVPTSLIGLAYFTAMGLWFAMLGRIPAASRWLWRVTLAGVSCGLAGSLFLVGLMAFALSEWCPMCLFAHGLNATLFLVTVWWWRSVHRAAGRRNLGAEAAVQLFEAPAWTARRPQARLAVSAAAMACVTAVAFWFYFDARRDAHRQWRKLSMLRRAVAAMQRDAGFVRREYFAQPVVDFGRSAASTPHAGPRLVVFLNYDCRACACFERHRPTLIDAAFAGTLSVEYRYAFAPATDTGLAAPTADAVRFAPTARPSRPTPALRACLAAEAARRQAGTDGFLRMHRLLFEHMKEGPDRDYARLARLAGLEVDRFLADMNSDEVGQRVQDDAALARRLGVTTTPALFLNGRRVPDLCAQARVFWQAMGREFLARAVAAPALAGGRVP